MEWRHVLFAVAVICLLFFGIPIKIKRPSPEHSFEAFVLKFNKPYVSNLTEYQRRLEIFKESLQIISELNSDRKGDSALYGITKFCDLTKEEFHNRHLRRSKHGPRNESYHRLKRAPLIAEVTKIDWRDRGVITPVRNQKLCGACWAFSTVETMEAMNAIKNRSLLSLSVQEVIDCAQNGNHGCDGGDSRLLLEWLLQSKTVVEPELMYPYIYRTDFCKYKPSSTTSGIQLSSYSCKNMVGAEEGIIDLLANHGPVAVAVNAANWQYYLGGVIQYHCSGDLIDLNHAVQIVGFDKSPDTPYFIARNSWGTDFGNSGYLKISIGSNTCGIANEVCSLDVV